jgi:superfamily II DNA or RNA helicase
VPSATVSSEKLLRLFHALAPHERRILQLLSVTFAPVSKHVLVTLARNVMSPEFDRRLCDGVRVGEMLDAFKNQKLVSAGQEGIRCNPAILHAVTLSAVAEKVFEGMALAVQLQIPAISSNWSSSYRSPHHALRDLRVAVYLHDGETAFATAVQFQRQFPYDAASRHPFAVVCNNPFDPTWFSTLPRPLRLAALGEILPYSSSQLADSTAAFEMLRQLAPTGKTEPDLAGLLCRELFLRGSIKEAEEAALESATSAQSAILACCALLRGERADSIELFEAALLQLKKETGKRKTFFADLTGPLYLIALIGSGDQSLLQRAEEFCSFVTKKREWPEQSIYEILELVIRERNGEANVTASLECRNHLVPNSPTRVLYLLLALSWCGSQQIKKEAEHFASHAVQARKAGYHWLADELSLLPREYGIEMAGVAAAEERYRSGKLTPLFRCVAKSEPWDNALSALIKLSRVEEQPEKRAAAQARLIWLVLEEGRSLEIVPREQKQNASGKWGAPKAVALKRLLDGAEQMEHLTPQDREICGCIKRCYGYYHGGQQYQLESEKALPLLVGHPHVYLDQGASVRLEVVPGMPELQVTSRGGGLKMEMFPQFPQDQEICVVMETPTRLKVYQAREEYRRISAIVGAGLTLPAHAREKALEAVGTLSSILTVHSDIGASAAEQVEGETTPLFHLLPYNAGVKIELLVRPFREAGPCFRPGAGGETVIAEVEGKRLQAKRDLRLEARRAAEAVCALPILAELEETEGEWLVPDTDDALELLLQLKDLGDTARVVWPGGAKFKVRQEATASHCRLTLRQAKDWFELEGELKVSEALALDLQELLQLSRENSGRFIPLGDGDFLALSKQLRKRLDELAALSEPHGKGVRFHRLASGVIEEFAAEAGEFQGDLNWHNHLKKLREAQSFQPQLPTTLQAELRGYQEEGFCWLNRLAHWGVGACLADDMGLGKTVQALAQILTMAPKGPSLVVAPTSVCLNWESETVKFAPTLNVLMFGGNRRQQALDRLKPFDLVICSYGLLQQEGEMLAGVKWQAIVLDEAQAIKNMATKRSQAAMELCGAFKMVATGTPIENHLGELWNVFRFINPGLLGSLKQFNVRFASPIEKTQDKKARGRLKKLIQPFILRRTKNQVLEELPSRTEVTIKVEMSEKEASFYEALRRSALETLAGIGKVEGKGEQHLKILAEIMRLRRACCNPRLVLPESPIPSSKLQAFGEILAELRENRHKALVFSQFVGHLEIIREYVEQQGIPYQYLDGSTPPRERRQRMDAFQSGQGDLFLISLKAGGVGLNLTAADYVIHMDPWWNPAVEDQASDRAHRIGQQRPVTIYRLVTKGTVEEKIVSLHQQKRGLADSLLEESDMSGRISAEELLELLRS